MIVVIQCVQYLDKLTVKGLNSSNHCAAYFLGSAKEENRTGQVRQNKTGVFSTAEYRQRLFNGFQLLLFNSSHDKARSHSQKKIIKCRQ